MTEQRLAIVQLDDPYVSTLVQDALAQHCPALAVTSEAPAAPVSPPALQWREYEAIDWDCVSEHRDSSLANAYCIRKGLIRKVQMANVFQQYCAKRPGCLLSQHVPETWIFQLDHPDYLDEAFNECWEVERGFRANAERENPADRERFILKPSMTGRGVGIYLLESLEDMERVIGELFGDSDGEETDDEDGDDERGSAWLLREWVIQRYVDKPLLLQGDRRKFHLRAYVLAVGRLRVYLYRDMLALFAGTEYDVAKLDAMDAHLTNTCLQQKRDGFDESQAVRAFWDLANHGLTTPELEHIFQQCCDVLGDCFEAISSDPIGFQPLPNAFELFGFDFLVDEAHKVWLLEANAFPDFAQTGHQLRGIVAGLFNDTVRTVVKPFVLSFLNDATVEHFVH
ncbi:tubulin-tyrosine ligase family-domain-containing protein [Thamnocephalis sphaerospora]|uniref:Tubulin-tyrosine ligase family-domain-containing protein n=1 Tax=Thamnocephalis sphaerospora TaxID=78915 RepID=A0A4P9XMU7_9FUNG|nr:tubulin-tyrosine ligase family-domain-containing protein [Thamnocephalis sphaerospora]|eukprot:RKP07267.1 tubulin-tyrosine ligase family-domain-containing protein [Thamnocephalis sphaerospora]